MKHPQEEKRGIGTLFKRLFIALLFLKVLIFGGVLLFYPEVWRQLENFGQGIFLPSKVDDPPIHTAEEKLKNALQKRAVAAKEFIKETGFDPQYAIFIDFSLPSGQERFFVWSFEKNIPVIASLVAHGYGTEQYRSTNQTIIFSNEPGSLSSSLGKYRLEGRAPSQWGIGVHYKMYGLEESNSNAAARNIVLHSYEEIPSAPIYPQFLEQGYSQGCPVIDNESMKKVDQLLKNRTKPMLLWIYND